MKHRKLFPDDSTTVTIQPPDCIYCLPGCPPNICTPVVIDLPSPPPPPPPPPPSHHHVSPYVIIFVCSVLGCFFFILLNVIRSKVRELNQASMNNRPPQSLSDGSEDENRVDHPIWLISTVGLQQSIINSIAVCKYKKGEGLVEGTECSVCLNEFQEDETLRLLPKCNHAFHVSCIDTWLKSHTNCPLCRASIISSTVPAPLPNQNPASSTGIANPQIDNSGSNRQLGENQERNGQNRTRTEGGEVLQAGVERILKPSVNSNENGVLQVLDDSDDDIQVLEDDSQPLRRSVSFDSSMTLGLDDFGLVETGNISVDQVNDAENLHSTIDNKQDGENPSISRQTGSCSSIVQCLHKSPVSMRTILSPRRNNNLKTVLPL